MRTAPRERQPNDYYSTPEWCVLALLRHVIIASDTTVVDPYAGTGAILSAVSKHRQCSTWGLELDAERAKAAEFYGVHRGDAFAESRWWPGIVITNPPYSRALECVQDCLRRDSVLSVTALLRLSFLEGQARTSWLRNNMPRSVLVLPKRPSFVYGRTDSCAYAWFIWQQAGHTGPALTQIADLSGLHTGKSKEVST